MYYFAYGSNMNWSQMQRRCPSAQFVCIACLPNYQFGITRHSRLRNCGTANVFPQPDAAVWGIVYEVSEADLMVMDSFEDGYRRKFLSVSPVNDGASSISVLVYVAEIEVNVPLPNAEYKRMMLEGAEHWALPPAYLSMLATIPTAK